MLDGSIEIECYQSAAGVEHHTQLLKELFADVDLA